MGCTEVILKISSSTSPIIGKIHFDNIITEALVKGLPVVEYSDNTAAKEIKDIWQ
ncbi:unnamed protein product, partial [marine sediment metagenome]